MSSFNAEQRARELEGVRDREFDALLEQEFASEPPVAAILQRAEKESRYGTQTGRQTGTQTGTQLAGPQHVLPSRLRSLVAAALALLGIGVAVALAWQARVDRDEHKAASPQDPSIPVHDRWPAGVRRVSSVDQLQGVPRDVTHLEFGMPLHMARDLSRFGNLQHLGVRLWPAKMSQYILSGSEAKAVGRLDVLATTKQLRTLSLQLLPLAVEDLAALGHVERLEVLELVAPFPPVADAALRAAAASGGSVLGRPFDRSFGAAVATSSRAKSLLLGGMPIFAEGLRALGDAKLQSLILDDPDVTPEVLLTLGELTSLRHLELRMVHSAAVEAGVGGSILRQGSRALTVAVLQRIAALPKLRSLTLDTCFLDHELVAALPRQLQRLDLSSCFGVDGRLADVVADMPELRELGLPLQMTDGNTWGGMWRPLIRDSNVHKLRVSGDDAAAILGSRAWQTLRLDGRLTKSMTTALANQNGLEALALTPTPDSESLAFVKDLPKLDRVTFVQVEISKRLLQPLSACASLRTVNFDACTKANHEKDPGSGLRDGIVTRWGYRMVR